jgi:microcystin-dependent protein
MTAYNLVRTAEAQPIGSVVPWVGSLTKIPKGWLLCNGAELNATDYPLLARILKDTYGGNAFSGVFPNYSGTFKLPSINQKALADISVSYFSSNTLTQPTINVDTPAAAAVVSQYIGTEGDLGPPQTIYATTDLNFSFTPDPDGTITAFTFVGTAPTATSSTLYSNVPATTTTGSGSGAFFNVVKNTNNTYSVILKQKGQNYVVGNTLTISFSLIGGTSSANNITITVTGTGNGFYQGVIKNSDGGKLQFTPGFDITPIYIVPRKLGRQHLPSHFHPGSYTTLDTGDGDATPGQGVGVFENATVTVGDLAWCEYPAIFGIFCQRKTINCGQTQYRASYNVWGSSQTTGEITISTPFETGVGRYSLASIRGTLPPKTHTALTTSSGAHGVAKTWFTAAKNLRDGLGNNTVAGNTALANLKADGKIRESTSGNIYLPFSDDKQPNYYINYDDGPAAGLGSDLAQPYQKVMFNNAAVSFTKTTRTNLQQNDVIQAHDHQGTINMTYSNGSLFIADSIQASVVPNVTPDNIPSAFQIIFTVPTASLAITTLIRAY